MIDLFWVSSLNRGIFFVDLFISFICFLIILNSIFVIISINPIYSILFLILVFLNSSVLLLIFSIDFIAVLLLVVYIGAIAVLFLFVIMMMDIRIFEIKESFFRFIPFGFFICIFFFLELFFLLKYQLFGNTINYFCIKNNSIIVFFNYYNNINKLYLINSISEFLYLYKWFYFFFCSIILFLSMVGAIFLTQDNKMASLKLKTKSQFIYKQVFADFFKRIILFYKK